MGYTHRLLNGIYAYNSIWDIRILMGYTHMNRIYAYKLDIRILMGYNHMIINCIYVY